MKWKIDAEPKAGDIRKLRVFAWRKTKVGDYWVWLETYQITELFFVSKDDFACKNIWDRGWCEVSRETLHPAY